MTAIDGGPRRIRVIVAKVGLDGHTTGAAVVAAGLRDAGFDVVNLGTRVPPEQIVRAALEEDVDVIGISILSGAHLNLARRVLETARAAGVSVPVVVGGSIASEDAKALLEIGVAAVFGPGSSITAIAETLDSLVATARHSAERQEG